MLIVVINYGRYMPSTKSKRIYTTTPTGKRLIDVIGEMDKSQDWIVKKFKKLEISMKLRNPPMDDPDLRWVERQIEKFDEGRDNYGKSITKNDLIQANLYWKKYNNG